MSSDKCSTREANQIVESNQLNSKFDKIEAVCSGLGGTGFYMKISKNLREVSYSASTHQRIGRNIRPGNENRNQDRGYSQ